MTHTYALLAVPQEVYDTIRAKLSEAGYVHAFHQDGDGEGHETIDLHGLALVVEEHPVTPLRGDGADERDREVVISHLCRLSAMVAERVYEYRHPADCFCGYGLAVRVPGWDYRYSPKVLAFIEQAVTAAIEAAKPKPAHDGPSAEA